MASNYRMRHLSDLITLGYRKTEHRRMSGHRAGNQEWKVMDCGSTVHRRVFLRGTGQSEVSLLHYVTRIASQLPESGGLWVIDQFRLCSQLL